MAFGFSFNFKIHSQFKMEKMIYPKFYFCRNGKSDLDWITRKLAFIPCGKLQEVCEQYEKLYLSRKNGRKDANEYLNGIATEFRKNGGKQKKM